MMKYSECQRSWEAFIAAYPEYDDDETREFFEGEWRLQEIERLKGRGKPVIAAADSKSLSSADGRP